MDNQGVNTASTDNLYYNNLLRYSFLGLEFPFMFDGRTKQLGEQL